MSSFASAFFANADADFWSRVGQGCVLTVVFGLVGIVLATLGFKIFDWLTPKINIEHELAEKHNYAVAIVAAAVILGICHIIATVAR